MASVAVRRVSECRSPSPASGSGPPGLVTFATGPPGGARGGGANGWGPGHRHRFCPPRPAPSTLSSRSRISLPGSLSPVQTFVNARTVDSTTTVTSWPGSSRHRSAVAFSTTSHHSRSPEGASVKLKWITTRRPAGNWSRRAKRRMSHMRKPASSCWRLSRLPIQRAPQCPMPTTMGRSSSPAGVRWYSQLPAPRRRSTTPSSSSLRSRCVSSVGDMRGTPRWMSLKRWLPQRSSRTTSGIHSAPSTSAPRATVQNWP